MNLRVAGLAGLCVWSCASAVAQTTWQPALHLAGSFERGRGAAFDAQDRERGDDGAFSLGFALDGRRRGAEGGFDASLFVLAHDPAASADRGLFAAARVRATRELGPGWRLVFDDAAKLQRRDRLALSDLQRNEAALGVERRAPSGRTLGLTLADRRRSVLDASGLGFERQALTVALGLPLGARQELQVQLGAQRFAADAGSGRRASIAAEFVRAGAGGVVAVRAGWLEPLSETRAGGATQAPGLPAADRPPGSFLGSSLTPGRFAGGAPASPPPAGLLGEGLLVDPLEADEDDWDLGRRKQELLALGSWRLGARVTVALRARLVRQRGPDLLNARGARVEEDGASLRLVVRRRLSARAALLVQAAFQARRDARPGFDYDRTVVAAGLEFRP